MKYLLLKGEFLDTGVCIFAGVLQHFLFSITCLRKGHYDPEHTIQYIYTLSHNGQAYDIGTSRAR